MSSRRSSLIALIVVPIVLLLSLVTVGVASARQTHQVSHRTHIATPTITIHSFSYKVPSSVHRGALVKVVNQDGVAHTVTSNVAGKFNVKVPGHSSRTFHAPGTAKKYGFHCTIHAGMSGVLKVT